MYREEILAGSTEYRCCLGIFCESKCPKIPCLCLEVCCCLGFAASANRIFIMERMQLRQDSCDVCLICCSNVLQILGCLMACLCCDEGWFRIFQLMADLFTCSVIACMQTQTAYEVRTNPRTKGVWPTLIPQRRKAHMKPLTAKAEPEYALPASKSMR
mmetsp:Transcript_5396/g.7614  ORF Transcript_5396/g.7614 Transcript_5396/m.7614 type:complete len:158 (+) Transcript_5396:382-855(+)|eukprot:jgi/Bigna1/61041/fgenesh1_kg.17_\